MNKAKRAAVIAGNWKMNKTPSETTALINEMKPLVENAVKHRVGDAPNGGTVKLSTREFPEYYEIEIADNGVGFDTENFDKSEEPHIGIENVRSRLELMCNGTLSIESSVGNGTTVTIRIPKED